VAQNLDLDLLPGNLAPDALDRRPFTPRAALDAMADCCESCFDQSRKACLTIASAFSFPSSERSARSTGTRT